MRRIALTLVLAGLVACSPSDDLDETQGEISSDGEVAELEEVEVPERITSEDLSGWEIQLDNPTGDVAGFRLVVEDGGLGVTTGPAGIAWRPVDLVMAGDYTASAVFGQRSGESESQEGYGIIVGGRNLDAPDARYTYFLVRPTGEYLIKRRDGEQTEVLVDWTGASAAADGQGDPAGTRLAVEVRGDEVRFLRNGTVVETLTQDEARPYGVAGVRVNHELDVSVTDWSLTGAQVGAGTEPGSDDGEAEEAPGGTGG